MVSVEVGMVTSVVLMLVACAVFAVSLVFLDGFVKSVEELRKAVK